MTTSDAKPRATGASVEGEPAVVTAGEALRDTMIAVAILPSPPDVDRRLRYSSHPTDRLAWLSLV
jgi:hypothetical protein